MAIAQHLLLLPLLLLQACSAVSARPVRLVGGTNSREGQVEVQQHGGWAALCDDSWDEVDAEVVCAELGLGGGRAVMGAGSSEASTVHFFRGSSPPSPPWLFVVSCQGGEASVLDCQGAAALGCGPSERAGVICDEAGSLSSFLLSGLLGVALLLVCVLAGSCVVAVRRASRDTAHMDEVSLAAVARAWCQLVRPRRPCGGGSAAAVGGYNRPKKSTKKARAPRTVPVQAAPGHASCGCALAVAPPPPPPPPPAAAAAAAASLSPAAGSREHLAAAPGGAAAGGQQQQQQRHRRRMTEAEARAEAARRAQVAASWLGGEMSGGLGGVGAAEGMARGVANLERAAAGAMSAGRGDGGDEDEEEVSHNG
jgi:hypothetical protein